VFYRGIAQRLLERRFGLVGALSASNVLFVLYHIGAQPLSMFVQIEIFVGGCIFGMIYFVSGSLLAAIALHTAYDAFYAFSPLLGPGIDRPWLALLQVSALLLCVVWVRRSRPTAVLVQTPSR